MLKKAALTAFVILMFIVYSINQRSEGSAPVVAASGATAPTNQSLTSTNTSNSPPLVTNSIYKDGTYTGKPADAYYGYIQVQVVISGGKITDVVFLDHPSDRRTSVEINTQAMPMLKAQAIKAQSAQVDGVSGATDTSIAFVQSLDSALTQAKA